MLQIIKSLPHPGLTSIVVSPSKLSVDFYGAAQELLFSDLASRPDFVDFSCFVVNVVLPGDEVTLPGMPIFSLFPLTKGTKLRPREYAMLQKGTTNFLIHVLVPHAGVTSFEECLITVFTTETVESNVPFTNMTGKNVNDYPSRPRLTLSGPASIAPDGRATIKVKFVSGDGKLIKCSAVVYAETDAGYLPKTRLQLTNGEGSLVVAGLYLEAGDQIRVKFGFKDFTGMASHVLKVAIPV